MTAERALAYSCNSYFTEMAVRLTDAELTAAYRRAGFGAQTRLAVHEAVGGFRPAGTRALVQLKAVGEEGITVTPMQMAAAYRWLAIQWHSPDAALSSVIEGLQGAVRYGTAQGAQVDGFEVAGKTGTATAQEGAWTHAWFAGFAPVVKPEVVVVIFLERGQGSEAAEIAGQVLKTWARGRR
jgi:cell division protein FtsI/penicillin-binding protein 2